MSELENYELEELLKQLKVMCIKNYWCFLKKNIVIRKNY